MAMASRQGQERRVIEDQLFTHTLNLKGAEWDGTVVRNNRFQGQANQGIVIGDVTDILIEGNLFQATGRNAIKLKDDQSRGSRNIIIRDNEFRDSPATAILVGEPNRQVQILDNRFENVGWNRSGNKQHAIYVKAPGTLVERNHINGVPGAHGISMRTAGVVRGNQVTNAYEAGIKYYASAQDTGNGLLLIENNLVTGCGKAGIAFARGDGMLIQRGLVRFNTLVNNRRSLQIHRNMGDLTLEVLGNVLVEKDEKYWSLRSRPRFLDIRYNLESPDTDVFIDARQGDFRLSSDTRGRGMVISIADPPEKDLLGRPLGLPPYDAGAIQSTEEDRQSQP